MGLIGSERSGMEKERSLCDVLSVFVLLLLCRGEGNEGDAIGVRGVREKESEESVFIWYTFCLFFFSFLFFVHWCIKGVCEGETEVRDDECKIMHDGLPGAPIWCAFAFLFIFFFLRRDVNTLTVILGYSDLDLEWMIDP